MDRAFVTSSSGTEAPTIIFDTAAILSLQCLFVAFAAADSPQSCRSGARSATDFIEAHLTTATVVFIENDAGVFPYGVATHLHVTVEPERQKVRVRSPLPTIRESTTWRSLIHPAPPCCFPRLGTGPDKHNVVGAIGDAADVFLYLFAPTNVMRTHTGSLGRSCITMALDPPNQLASTTRPCSPGTVTLRRDRGNRRRSYSSARASDCPTARPTVAGSALTSAASVRHCRAITAVRCARHDGAMEGDEHDFGPGWADAQLNDLEWRTQVGDNPERVFREAMRRAIAIRDGGNKARAVVLVAVLHRLGELAGYDSLDLWEREVPRHNCRSALAS